MNQHYPLQSSSLGKQHITGDFASTSGSSAGSLHVEVPLAGLSRPFGCCPQFQNDHLWGGIWVSGKREKSHGIRSTSIKNTNGAFGNRTRNLPACIYKIYETQYAHGLLSSGFFDIYDGSVGTVNKSRSLNTKCMCRRGKTAVFILCHILCVGF